MKKEIVPYTTDDITTLIITVRGKRVILDADLACIYGVPTKRLNEQVRRNADRFPLDFAFVLTDQEVTNLRSQIATSSFEGIQSQFATASHGGRRYRPYVFTEHGVIMAANVLRSRRAIQMSVFVVRAFVRMRQILIGQKDLARKLSDLEKELTARLDVHETAINEMFTQIKRLLSPPSEPEPRKKRIGFLVEEPHVPYKSSRASKKWRRE
jgi:hypothetical protein